LPVKFVWTHDAFRVGEDGPTHQPIEHEAQIRLLEQVKNDAGNNSLLVLRPADSAETTVAWQMAMENKKSPTALILSRQSINDLPTATGNRFADATKMRSGAYTVEEVKDAAVTLVGNGSEVSTLCAASEMLKKDGIACRIVSIPSVGLFLNQSEDYRNSVLPVDMPVFGLTAGLPSALLQVVGAKGTVFGLNHFGASAPYDILDEKFGFTPENVANQIRNFVKLKKSR
jgi:transketolase